VLLESNHDPHLLATGPYPPFLKERVAGNMGHLSNGQAASLVEGLRPAVRDLVLMHLSEKNNRPDLAIAAACEALEGSGALVHAASAEVPIVLGRNPRGQVQLQLSPALMG